MLKDEVGADPRGESRLNGESFGQDELDRAKLDLVRGFAVKGAKPDRRMRELR